VRRVCFHNGGADHGRTACLVSKIEELPRLGIFRVYTLAAPAAGAAPLRSGLLAFGLLSMAVGVIFLISQRDFKRLLAYSSVEQIGLICVGVGIGTPLALLGALLLIVAHGLTKCLMFFATGNLLLRFRTTAISGGVSPAKSLLT